MHGDRNSNRSRPIQQKILPFAAGTDVNPGFMNAYHLELLNIEDSVVFYTVMETGFKRHS